MAGPSLITTAGPLVTTDRIDGIRQPSRNPNVTKYTPFSKAYPTLWRMDKIAKGSKETVDANERIWYQAAYNGLNGTVGDILTEVSGAAYVSGGVANTVLILKCATASIPAFRNVQQNDVLVIQDSVTGLDVFARVTGAPVFGGDSNTYVSVTLLTADASAILASASLTWCITQRAEKEIYELGDAVSEHETPFMNYVQEMSEAHEISERELMVKSELNENRKADRARESLVRLMQKRFRTLLYGQRLSAGSGRFYAGGLRWFLETYESANLVNWATDTTYSAATDRVSSGTIPFLREIAIQASKYTDPTDTLTMLMSQTKKNILSSCVLNSGHYTISKETNSFGLEVDMLLGVGPKIELMVEAEFNTNPVLAQATPLFPTKFIKVCPFKNGAVTQIPWSSMPAQRDGDNFKTSIKGGHRVIETYEFHHIDSMFWIRNLGVDKA
jgi:hypothetical protein